MNPMIYKHCGNCKDCVIYRGEVACNIKYKYIMFPRLSALLCRYFEGRK